MKKNGYRNILIIAALAVFFAVLSIGLIFCGNSYEARAEEEIISQSESIAENEAESEETGESEEIPDGEIKFDLDAFLAFVQKYAEEAGVGNEYAKAVEAIRTAATQKQVTLSTVINGALLLVMFVYVIAKSLRKKKEMAALSKASVQLSDQTKVINEMVDELNANEKTAEETEKRLLDLETGFRDFIKGFMTFVDRTRVDKESKETIRHELNAAIKATDGETEADGNDDQAQ